MTALLASLAPIRLVTGEEPPPVAGSLPWFVGLAVLLFLLGLALLALRRWLARQAPEEQAFLLLALLRGLGPRSIARLRRLAAAHGRAAPVALLLSGDALAAAIRRYSRNAPGERERRAALRLGERLSP